jgi:hypothetical protein
VNCDIKTIFNSKRIRHYLPQYALFFFPWKELLLLLAPVGSAAAAGFLPSLPIVNGSKLFKKAPPA